MTGTRKITVIILVVVFGLFGAFNWWRYLQGGNEIRIAVKPASSSRTIAATQAGASSDSNTRRLKPAATGTATALQKGLDEEPPKRLPLPGEILYDPFKREQAKNTKTMKTSPWTTSIPKAAPKPEASAPVYTLELILVDGDRRLALVNGRLYEVGDRVGTMTIIRIRPKEVVLRDGSGDERVLRLSSDKI